MMIKHSLHASICTYYLHMGNHLQSRDACLSMKAFLTKCLEACDLRNWADGCGTPKTPMAYLNNQCIGVDPLTLKSYAMFPLS